MIKQLTNNSREKVFEFGLKGVALALALSAFAVGADAQEIQVGPIDLDVGESSEPFTPGWYIYDDVESVSPSDAINLLSSSSAQAPAAASSATLVPSTVGVQSFSQALASSSDYSQVAAALENDALRIYQFVRNNFDYAPYFGLMKGPYLTLMERAGNDFDQAALLVELLRAAGYTANYKFGEYSVPSAERAVLANALSTDSVQSLIIGNMANSGIPVTSSGSTIIFSRIWVEVDVGGTVYSLDPAFKPLDLVSGVDLDAASGFSKSGFLAAAGGTLGANSISNVDTAGIDSYLTARVTQLKNYLDANHPEGDIKDVIGGYSIVQDYSSALPANLPFTVSSSQPAWTEVPDSYVHKLEIDHGGIVDFEIDMPEVAGKKLSIRYIGTGTIPDPPAGAQDLGSVGIGQLGPEVTFSFTNSNPIAVTLNTTVVGSGAGAYDVTQGASVGLAAGASTTIGLRLSGVGETAGRKNATLRIVLTAGGSSSNPSDTAITGVVENRLANIYLDDTLLIAETAATGTLNDLTVSVDHPYMSGGGTYLDQSETFNVVRDGIYVLASGFGGDQNSALLAERQRRLAKMSIDGTSPTAPEYYSETLNIIGQSWLRQTELNDGILSAISGKRTYPHHRFGIVGQEDSYFVDVKVQGGTTLTLRSSAVEGAFQASGFVASAMEHSVLEQLQGTDTPGISTIRIFDIHNQAGGNIYLMNSSNFSTVSPLLTNYSSARISAFQTAVNGGSTLILPSSGEVQLNDWKGVGYIDYRYSPTARSQGMIIGGGLNGGFASTPSFINPITTIDSYQPFTLPPTNITQTFGLDPVDLFSGAFVSDTNDLSLGAAGVRGLSFTRSYNGKNAADNKAGLGHGWTHNYYTEAVEHTDVEGALGDKSSFAALPMIIAAHAARSLVAPNQPDVQEWVVGALAANWATDELLNNAVTIQSGSSASTFIQMPDGSYVAPGDSTDTLTQVEGNYRITGRFGTVTNFNSDNRISDVTDIDGNSLNFTYSGDKLTQVQDAFSRALTLNYTGDDLTSVSDFTGRTVSYSIAGEELTGVTGLDSITQSYTYDSLHRMLTMVDGEGSTLVDNTYDEFDRVVSQIAPRQTGSPTYNIHYAAGLSTAEEDPFGGRTTYYYDYSGRPLAVEDALGNIARSEYDGLGRLVKSIDPLGNETTRSFDNRKNLVSVINPEDEEITYQYDVQDRLIRTIDPLLNDSETDYDAEHHVIAQRDALDNEVALTYRADGLPLTSEDPRGIVATTTYGSYGQPDSVQVATEPAVNYVYSNIGELISLTDQAGAQTQFAHNDRSLVTTRTDALSSTDTYIYNNNGMVTSSSARDGETTTITYTPTNKINSISYPSRTANMPPLFVGTTIVQPAFSVSYTYDDKDRLVSMADQHGTLTNTYDAADRLTGHTDANGNQVQYDYDANGRITRVTYPDGNTVSYQYDAASRLVDVSVDWLSVNATINYDAAGRIQDVQQFNGTDTTFGYDAANRLTSLSHDHGTTLIADYQFTLDPTGNRIQEVANENVKPSGLIDDSQTKTFNTERNRILTAGVLDTFTYDPMGGLNFQTFEGALPGGTPLRLTVFDGAGRVVMRAHGAGSAPVQLYTYDGAGNRLSSTINSVTTEFVYDAAGNLLAETDDSGNIQKYFIHGIGLMAMVDAATGELYVYHFDGTGHTVAMTDSTGAVSHSYAYSPYGAVLAATEAVPQPFTYAGQVGIYRETGDMYYMRARYYSSELQQFLSEDPIDFDGGINLYAYVGGNPISFVDPNGELPLLAILPLVGGAVSGGLSAADAFFAGGDFGDVLKAGGLGFASGFVGTGVGLISGNPLVGGAVAGAAGNGVSQYLSGDEFSLGELAVSTALGSFSAGAASRVAPIKPGTFMPSLTKNRTTAAHFGPNTKKTIIQTGASSAIGAGIANIGGK